MKRYMAGVPTVFDNRVNENLIHNSNEDDIQTILYEMFKSLEVNPHIKIIDFQFKTCVDENPAIYTKSKYRKQDDVRYIFPSRYGLAVITIKIEYDEIISSKLGQTTSIHRVEVFDKHLLIPIPDENGVFLINGIKSRLIYQLVDKTLYITKNAIVIKSIMPIIYLRTKYNIKSLNGDEFVLPLIEFVLFNKYYPVLLIYLCDSPGLILDILEVSKIMRIVRQEDYVAREEYEESVFVLSKYIYLCVHKDFLMSPNHYVQSLVAMFSSVFKTDTTYDDFLNSAYWISRFDPSDVQKSISIFNTIERMLDETTKRKIRVDNCYKTSIRALSKWVLMNYDKLRNHNNMDLKNKRFRSIEALFTELNAKLSYGLTEISKAGSKIKFDKYKKLFNFQSNYVRSCIQRSDLLRYDQSINDMNFMTFFKFTRKGPNALGNNRNGKTITDTYRDINSSMVGKIDIISSSKSDPGQSGYIIPFVELKDMMFDNSPESNRGAMELAVKINECLKDSDEVTLEIPFNSPEEYNEKISNILTFCEMVNAMVSYADSPRNKEALDDLEFLNSLEMSRIYNNFQEESMSVENLVNELKHTYLTR